MKLIFVAGFTMLGLFISGCGASKQPAGTFTKHYLALGDSYTIGKSVDLESNFPYQLRAQLNQTKAIWSTPEIIARTGWRTDQLLSAISNAKLTHSTYDLVTLLIGVNNEFQGKTVDEFASEFAEILKLAIRLAGDDTSKVWVISIPDYGFTPYGKSRQLSISARIDQFNAKKKELANEAGVRFIDITGISREGLKEESLVADDGLHPSAKMYEKWVELMK